MSPKLDKKIKVVFHNFVEKYQDKVVERGKLYRVLDIINKDTDRELYEIFFWLGIEYVFVEIGIGEVDRFVYLSNDYEKMYSNDNGM